MNNKFITKIIGATLAFAMMIGGAVGINANKQAKEVNAAEAPYYTFQTAKSTNNTAYATNYNVTINGIQWNVPGNQNFSGYVRIGGKKADGKALDADRVITGKNAIDKGISKITVSHNGVSNANLQVKSFKLEVSSVSTFASIDDAITYSTANDNMPTISTSTAGNFDFTPTSGTGWAANSYYRFTIHVYNNTTTNYGFDLKKMEFYEDTSAQQNPTVEVSSSSLFFRTGSSGQTVTATASNFSGNISYSWEYQSGTDCVNLTNASSATVTMTPKNSVTEYATGVYTVTATHESESASAEVTVIVDNGTESNPYTVAQARSAIDHSAGKQDAYVKGVVCKVDTYFSTPHAITYWISDNGAYSSTTSLQAYKGLAKVDDEFSSKDDVKIGDIVEIKGDLKKYNSTYELDENNRLFSQISIDAITVNTAPSKVDYNEDEYFDPTGLVVTATYNDAPNPTTKDFAYADLSDSFDFDPSTSVALTNEEHVTITFLGKSTVLDINVTPRIITGITVTGEMNDKEYVLGSDWDFAGLELTVAYNIGENTVIDFADLTVGTDFTVSSEKASGVTSLTIAGTYSGTAITSRTITGITYTTSMTLTATSYAGYEARNLYKGGISISMSDGTLINNTDYRTYKNQTITIACQACKIIKIEFTFTGNKYNSLEGTGYTKDGTSGTWAGYSNSVTLTAAGEQARATQIIVTVSEVNQDDVDALKTSTTLAYHYSGNTQDGFEFSNVSIRFGGIISKTLWNGLDTNDHNISGFGVMIASGEALNENELIKENLNAAKLADANPAPSIDEADIVDYYMSKAEMATPVEQGDNYVWNLFQRIDEADVAKVFVAVAYIKVGGDYIFMEQVRYSAKTLAADYIANRGCNSETAAGSLAALAA